MGYLFLVLATLCGSVKGYAGKKSSSALDTLPAMLYFGAWRTAFCALLGLAVLAFEGGAFVSKDAVIISIISGISMSVFLLSWIAAVRGGAYVRLDVCCQTGMVIPCIFAAPLLKESVSPFQYMALGALVIAIILLGDRGKKIKEKAGIKYIALLLIVWLSSGTNSLTVKLYSNTGSGKTFYNLVTFLTAAVAFSVAYLFLRGKGKSFSLPKKHYFFYLPIMAVCLYLNILLQTFAADHLSSMVMFPLQTILGLLISAFMAVVLFKEKVTVKNAVGMVISAASIIAINVL